MGGKKKTKNVDFSNKNGAAPRRGSAMKTNEIVGGIPENL